MNAKSLAERIENLEKKAASKELILPAWPDNKRGTPNAFLRSALFSATQSKDRIYLKNVVLASQAGISIEYTGEQLNQEDLSLWETLVHLAKDSVLGNVCEFTSYGILTAMGLGTGSNEQARLKKGVTRLIACSVIISIDGIRAYESSLIMSSETNRITDRHIITLNRQLINLYKQSTWIDWDQRVKLRKKPLAQALHGYYSSHKKPYALSIDKIKEITGAKNKQQAGFKRQVAAALDELVKIGFLEDYTIDEDKVTVKKI